MDHFVIYKPRAPQDGSLEMQMEPIRVSTHARGRRCKDALECELQGLLMALQHCWSLGYGKIIMESDSQKATDIINNNKLHFDYYNWQREIKWWKTKFQDVRFQWTKRNANKVADCLAKRVQDGKDFEFNYYEPQYLHNLLHVDHVHSI